MTVFDIFCSNTTISMQLVRQYTSCISDYFFRTPLYQQLVPPCTNRKSEFFNRHHHLLTDHNVINYPNAPPCPDNKNDGHSLTQKPHKYGKQSHNVPPGGRRYIKWLLCLIIIDNKH